MSDNEIKQKITLDNKEHLAKLRESNDALKTMADEGNKKLVESSKGFDQNEKQVKKWGKSVKDELDNFKKSFSENLATGAKALALDAGIHALHTGAADAISMAADADEKFAEFRSRVDASDETLKKWRTSIGDVAISTKTNLASMEQAFMDLSDSADPEKIQDFLGSIGQATLLAHGNSKAVTDFVTGSLTDQGKEVNKENVEGVLTGADLLRRRGRGFGTMEQAMTALGGLDQRSIAQSGLSESGIAALLAGASRSGVGAGKATAGINDILKASAAGQLNALGGILGVGSLTGQDGKLDLTKLGSSKALAQTHLGNDENTSRELFRQVTAQAGMSSDGADALFAMIRNFKEFNTTVRDAAADTKKLSSSADQAGDNIKSLYQQMQTKLVRGFEDIFQPLGGVAKSIISGHPMDALGQLPGAAYGTLKGIGEHPLLAGGAVLGTAAGGALISGLLKKVGLGGIGGTAAGVAKGSALKAAGVEPVYVVNASEIGDAVDSDGGSKNPFMAAAKGVGLAGFNLAKGGLGVGAAAAGGYAIGSGLEESGIAKAVGLDAGFQLLFEKLDKLTSGALSGVPQKVAVEIQSNDPMFSAKPKSTDNIRDARTQ